MAIIGKVEKKDWRVRLLNLAIHAVLLLGAATMVYPLLLMISGSFKSDVDFYEFSLMPKFIYDDTLLFKKHLLTKYNAQNVVLFNDFRLPVGALNNLPVPESVSRPRYDDYKQFLNGIRRNKPHYWRCIGMAYENGVVPLTLRDYRAWLVRKYGAGTQGLVALNAAYGTSHAVWDSVALPSELFLSRRAATDYESSPFLRDLLEFKNTQINYLHTGWTDIDAPFTARLRTRYANRLDALNRDLGTDYNTWNEITLPLDNPADQPRLASLWRHYINDEVNPVFLRLDPAAAPHWRTFLKKKYNSDLLSLNRMHDSAFDSFDSLVMPESAPRAGQLNSDWNYFILEILPSQFIHLQTLSGEYRKWLKERYKTLDRLNQEFELGFKSFESIPLPASAVTDNLRKQRDWRKFVESVNPEETGLSRNAISDFRSFISSRFKQGVRVDYKEISLIFKHDVTRKNEIPFYTEFPSAPEISSRVKDLYLEFITRPENADYRTITHPEKLKKAWVRFLRETYKDDLHALNSAWSCIYTDWNRISPPTAEYEWFNVIDNRVMLIKEYLKRNYLMVFDTIQTNGFAAENTLIYCLLAVLASLLVNPLCAYGLSRFKMAPAYKILLFLMLPMAFPAMVLGIPQFLLIKNLGLLNTFAALILPTMANGYMIFLLKGFFDSLPRELFESAAIDGAGEWTVFWNVAMSLSTPILSVLALNTFTAAYGNFMMAFLLCQDQSMWTMMVYLYQLQMSSSQAVGFAALIIAAIPTLLVFIFCQNIIIKGIVVPTEK